MPALLTGPDLVPPRDAGALRSFGLALLVHALLVATLTWGVNWKNNSSSHDAELWAAVPQQATPRPVGGLHQRQCLQHRQLLSRCNCPTTSAAAATSRTPEARPDRSSQGGYQLEGREKSLLAQGADQEQLRQKAKPSLRKKQAEAVKSWPSGSSGPKQAGSLWPKEKRPEAQ
jgi:colicin import membrane protein